MTTPDPIALPELPKSLDSVRVIARGVPESARPHGHYYNVEQLSAYGKACVEALTPTADAVLRFLNHLEDVMDAHPEVADWVDVQLWNAISTPNSSAPSTPPLNELLGQREEFNLNEVSGNSGQLASLEQRARELYDKHTSDHPTIHCNRFPAWDELSGSEREKWRKTAALSAQKGESP